ncbi:MAG TPA: YXWGXW repeat-containing protein [Candidatus Solibacter sp.]|nr:YXWGXW repeat-containing protein [Candidatus Solibacter sp.]
MRRVHLVSLILFAALILALPAGSSAQVSIGVAVHIGPPALPVYEQPICPEPGFLWTPGYWAYGPEGYYWVPGTWVRPPEVGLLWTPGYWGWGDGGYRWHAGYWGPHVGFYGGINYGFGYTGVGFVGGRWEHGVFAYNTAVMRVNTRVIRNTYVDRTVIRNVRVNRVSYNGGRGGIEARPSERERSFEREHHFTATSVQTQHERFAGSDRSLRASENHGRPAITATARPGQFSGHGASATKGYSRDASPNGGNVRSNNASESHKIDRPQAHGGGAGYASPHGNHAENAPRNQPHGEGKPHTESKPHGTPPAEHHEGGGGKPHRQ